MFFRSEGTTTMAPPIRWHDDNSSSIWRRNDSDSPIYARDVGVFPETRVRHRLLGGARFGVAHDGVPPPTTTPTFPMRE